MDVASAFCDHFCCPWFRDLPNFNVEVSSEWWILEVYWIMTLSIFTFSLFCLPYTHTHTLSPAFHGLSMLLMCYLFLSVKSWNILFLGWMDSRWKYYLHRFYLLIEMKWLWRKLTLSNATFTGTFSKNVVDFIDNFNLTYTLLPLLFAWGQKFPANNWIL